jgi:transposase
MQTAELSIEKLLEINREQALRIAQLEHMLEQLSKVVYGSRSEKRPHPISADQLSLFDVPVQEKDPQYQTITRRKPEPKADKKPSARMELPAHLPREVMRIEPAGINPEECVLVAEDITETLEIRPAQFYVKQIVRPRYCCKVETGEVAFLQAAVPSSLQPLPKAIAGASLLAYLLVSKYEDHLPLHRLIKMIRREKVELAESTVNDWVQGAMKLLEPLFESMLKQIRTSGYLMADESPIPVLDSLREGSTHKGYYWVFYAPLSHLIMFIYHKSRGGDAPKEFLIDFEGYLQVDGYSVYDQFERRDGITLLACMAHIRRKFHEALSNDKERAEFALEQIGLLYGVEKQAREEQMSHGDRFELRNKKSAPLLNSLKAWMLEQYSRVLPRSAIGQALSYALQHWNRACNYLNDGRLEIDNNWVENKIRPLALGRKNYLFAGSHEAAARAGIIYSFFAMCRKEEINPMEWLSDVLTRIQDQPINKIEQLLPFNWKKEKEALPEIQP